MNRSFTYSAVLLLAVAGCGGPANKYDAIVTGTVTVDGELAKSGTVTFHPIAEDKGKVAIGRIHPDGSYSLRTGQGDLQQVDGGTVEPGEYIVTVSVTAPPTEGSLVGEGGPPIPGPSLVAAKYSSKQSSDLKRTVKAGSQIMILELEPADATPPGEEPADESAAADTDANPTTESPAQEPSATETPAAAEKSVENAQP